MRKLAVYFLDVGQGDCSVIVPPPAPAAPASPEAIPEDAPILVDCADSYVAESFLSTVPALSGVVLSHLDRDHIGGLRTFLKNFLSRGGRVGTVWIVLDRPLPHPRAHGPERTTRVGGERRRQLRRAHRERESLIGGLLGELLQEIKPSGNARWGRIQALQPISRGVKPICLQKGNDWDISLLLPFGDQMISALRRCRGLPNRASAVLRVVHHGGAVLIGADAPLGSWERLAHVETPESKQLSAEVFRIPHHGGSIREGKKLLERSELYQRVSAKIAVCSVGTQNPYGHPHEDHLRDACRGGACRLLCTELNSTCHKDPLSLRDKMLEKASGIVYPLRQLAAPGDGYLTRRGKLSVPCAGTILAEIDEKGHVAVSPSKGGWHDEMVALFDSPICREHLEKRQASSQRLGT